MDRTVKTEFLTQVSHNYRAYMPEKARPRQKHGNDEGEKEGRRPGGDLIAPDTAESGQLKEKSNSNRQTHWKYGLIRNVLMDSAPKSKKTQTLL
jgi:hypothetical protein